MYPVKSTRMFFGTNTERTASGLASFLPGDEFYETDTGNTYQHNGTAWTQKNTGGSPGGSNTQLQYNNSGAFGGTSGLVWDSVTGKITHTKNTATALEYFLVLDQDGAGGSYINMISGAASGRIGMRSTFFDIASTSPVNISGGTVGLSASTDINFDPGGYAAVYFRGGATPEAVFNEQGDTGYAFRIETGNNEYMVYVDPTNDAFQIGGAMAGTIADFRSSAIVFNDGEADIDLRIAGSGVTYAYFYDAGNNRHGFGTGSPGAFVYIDNTETSGTPETGLTVDNTYSPSSDPGAVFPTSLSLLADYDSSVTPAGGFVLAQFLRVRNVSNGVMPARCLDIQFQNLGNGTTSFFTGVNVRTPTNSGGGAITTAYGLKVENQNIAGTNYAIYTDAGTVRLGDGVILGAPTGGNKGSGTINVAGNVYKNNTAYTNPDYALEHWATGSIKRFSGREGAQDYYRLSLDESEQFVRENLHLPRISRDPAGIFDMADMALEKIEEAHIYIYELNNRVKALEQRLANEGTT